MNKKLFRVIAAICLLGTVVCAATLTHAAARQAITGFAVMAASIEKNIGALLELELTMQKNEPVYKAEVIINGMKTHIYFDASTGKEIKRAKTKSLTKSESRIYNDYIIAPAGNAPTGNPKTTSSTPKPKHTPAITYAGAREIALDRVGGGYVEEIELDREGGRLIYEVEVKYNRMEYNIKIDAETGVIVGYRTDK